MSAHRIPLPQTHQTAAQTILLVEDEALIALSEKLMLQRQGFSVLMAADGESAVETALRTPEIDLILMDINLGSGIDGTEAAQQILAQRDLPILFLSSHTEPEVVEKTEKITSYGYVVKHSGETVLLASIKMAFKLFDAHQRLKQQEAALRESLQASADIVQSIPSGFFIYQFEAPDRLILLNANPEGERLTGIRTEQWKGREFNEIWPEARKHGVTEHYLEVMRTGVTFETEDLYYSDERLSGAFRIRAFALPQNRLAVAFENITERKRMEEALRESEALFRLQFELGNIGITIASPEKAWLQVNQRLCDMLGYSAAEIRQTTWDALTHPDDVAADLAQFQRMAAGEIDRYELDKRFIRKDGAIIYTHLAAACSRNPDRSLRFTIGSILDITDRKQAEEALRKSEEKFRALFDNVPIGVALHEIIVDHDNHPIDFIWLDCNPAYETMTSLKRQDIIGKRGLEVIPSLERKWIEFYGNVALTGEAAMIIDHSDYLDRHWEVRAYSPGPMQFAVAMNDITARKHTEEALRISEERLRLAHKATNDVVWDWDVRHDAQQWNESGKVVFGWTEIVEHPVNAAWWGDRIHPEDQQRVEKGFWEVVNNPETDYWHDEYRFQKADGSYAQVMDRGYVLRDTQGRAVRMIGAMLDINDRKQAEEALRENEALLRTIADNYPDSYISIIEKDLRVGFTSGQEFKRQNLDPAQFVGLTLEEVFGALAGTVREHYLKTFAGQEQEFELFINNQHQRYRTVPLRASDGTIPRILSVVTDITARKLSEEALRESEARLVQAQQIGQIGSWELKVRTGEVYWSEEMCRLFEIDPVIIREGRDQLQAIIEERVHPDDLAKFTQSILTTLAQHSSYNIEYRLHLPSGLRRVIHAQGQAVFDQTDQVVRIVGTAMDITDLKQAEEALRESEERFRQVVENIEEVFWIGSPSWSEVFYISPAYEQIWGRSCESLVAQPLSWFEAIIDEDRQRVTDYINEKRMGEFDKIVFPEYRIMRPDGELRWISARGFPIFNEQGGVYRIVGIAENITVRKQAEEALQKAKEFSENLIASMLDGFSVIDPQGMHIDVNPALCQMTGFAPEELLGVCPPHPYWPPEAYDDIENAFQYTLHGDFRDVELTFMRKNGERFPVIVSPSAVQDKQGHVLSYVATVKDITERKQAEEALQQSEKKYRELFDESLTGNFILNGDGIIQDCNPAFMRIFGYADKAELLGQPITIAYPDRTEFDYIVSALKQRQKIEHYETTRKRKDGVLIRVDINLIGAFDERGELLRITGYLYNITKRKQAEEALRQSEQQLRELNAQKDKFFSILAHDLKNPLLGFLSFADIVEHNFGSLDSEERKMLTQHFRISAETLFALLDNLLTWARLQRGQVEYYFDHFPLDQLAAHAVDLLTLNAEQKQIRLINTTPPVSVYASIEMVDTIVRNLLANAIKFTPFGGEVTITATQKAYEVQVTVADTGIGIPPDQLDQLFRIDGKTQREGTSGEKGTGLGLILCKEFVEKQGGRIWAESEPESGARIMFTLPTQPPEREP